MSNDQVDVRALAAAAATHPRIEQAILGALRVELPSVIEDLLRQSVCGETVRVYAPRRSSRERSARDLRILAAAASGISTAEIAVTENVSRRTVQMVVKGKI